MKGSVGDLLESLVAKAMVKAPEVKAEPELAEKAEKAGDVGRDRLLAEKGTCT